MKMGSARHKQQDAIRAVTPTMAAERMILSDAKSLVVSALLLAVAVVLAYMNSLSAPFIFDDIQSVVENPYIRKLWPLSNVLFKAIPDSPPAGRPVVSLSLAINYALGGLDVRGYHLFNIAVHLVSAYVLWGILRQTLLNTPLNVRFGQSAPFLAFAVALIWAVHPLQTESVTYISQRTELLMGLFYLLTLFCAILAWHSSRRRLWSVLAVVTCAIGMGCKETMVSAPFIVLLYDVMLVSPSLRDALRRHWRLYIGLAATWGLLAWFNLSGPRIQTCGWDLGIHPLIYLRTQADIIVWYLRLCFWPHPLVISYQDWIPVQSIITILPQGLFIVALLFLTAWALWRRHPAALLGAWFFMILAPTSSFIPIVTEIAAERRMYLPLAAVIIAVVVSIYEMTRWANRRLAIPLRGTAVIAPVVLVLIVATLDITTFMRNRDYQSAIGIWTDAVDKRPDNARAWFNLGLTRMYTGETRYPGEIEQAVSCYTRAIALNRNEPRFYDARGAAYVEMGNYAQAIQDYNQAIDLRPDYAKAYYGRGIAYGWMHDYSSAISDFTRMIELQPESAKAYYDRGVAYSSMNDYDRAIRDYTKAIELKPDYVEAYYYRGKIYSRMRDFGRAIHDWTRAIGLQPNSAEAYYNRGVAYGIMNEYNRAIQDYTKTIELKSDHVNAYNNRGNIYVHLRDYVRALKDHSMAIELKPDYAIAYINRANTYYFMREYDKAWLDIEKCKQLGGQVNPEFIEALSQVSSRPS